MLLQYPAFGRLSSKDVQGRKPVERAFREGRFETSLLGVNFGGIGWVKPVWMGEVGRAKGLTVRPQVKQQNHVLLKRCLKNQILEAVSGHRS